MGVKSRAADRMRDWIGERLSVSDGLSPFLAPARAAYPGRHFF
jgi:hypothetical protein